MLQTTHMILAGRASPRLRSNPASSARISSKLVRPNATSDEGSASGPASSLLPERSLSPVSTSSPVLAPSSDAASSSPAAIQGLDARKLTQASYLTLAGLGFWALTSDVLSPDSFIQGWDNNVSAWSLNTWSFEQRLWFNKYYSNIPLDFTGFALLGTAGFALKNDLQAAAIRIAVAFTGFSAVTGIPKFGDPYLTKAVKATIHRIRPTDDILHSFSYPSGHSTGYWYAATALVFILLPVALNWHRGAETESEAARHDWQKKMALAALVMGGMWTVSGRICADVHWMSDCIGGTLFGTFCAISCLIVAESIEGLILPRKAAVIEAAAAIEVTEVELSSRKNEEN